MTYTNEFVELRMNRGLEALMAMVGLANGYFADAAPWELKTRDPERMATVLATTVEAVRRIAVLAQPIIPASAAKLLDQLGVGAGARQFADLGTPVAPGTLLPPPAGVFPRWVEA